MEEGMERNYPRTREEKVAQYEEDKKLMKERPDIERQYDLIYEALLESRDIEKYGRQMTALIHRIPTEEDPNIPLQNLITEMFIDTAAIFPRDCPKGQPLVIRIENLE
jgi:hypothetical protein